MAVIHDLICDSCEEIYIDVLSTAIGTKCAACRKGILEIYYGNWGKRDAEWLSMKSSAVVYKNPSTGKIIYPGRNDAAMPERYRVQGYERIEMRSVREIDRFSRKHGLVNEAAHYDRGSGRSYDEERH